jgi:uncharacterized protein
MPRKIPMRRCVATGERCEKRELLRIVRTPEGTLAIDSTGKLNGHGAYLKKSEEAVMTAKKNGALKRALEVEIPDEFYDEILKAIQ